MSQTLSLYRLQQTDSRVDRVNARITEIQKIIDNDEVLQLAIIAADKTTRDYQDAQRALHIAEAAVQDQRTKIEQNEASLYSGAIKNPKELQDLQNEVASLKRHLITLEDRLLDAMISCEEAEALQRDSNQKFDQERQRVAGQNSELTQEMNELAKEKDKLATERLAIAGSVPEHLLRIYEDLRKQKRGIAVSSVADNACEICGTTLTPAQAQASRLGAQMIHCPNCGRILYGN